MKYYLAAFWFLILATVAQATVVTPDSKQVNLLHDVQFLEDPSGKLNVEDVRAMASAFQPWRGGGTNPNFGFTSSAYWVRVPLQRLGTASENWLLELNYAKLYELDFYPPNEAAVHTGSSKSFNSRPYFDRFFVLPIKLTTQTEDFYIRATSMHALTLPLTIWQPDHYRYDQQRFQFLQFSYYGGLLMLALYGLVIYLSIKDRRFLIYFAFIVTAGLGIFAGNGYGRQLIWPEASAFDEISQSALLSLAAFFAVLFARSLLLSPDEHSWLTRLLRLSQYLFLVICLLTLLQLGLPELARPTNELLMLNSLLMGILVSAASVRVFLKKRQGIRFFLMGWLVIWLGITVASLRMFGWVPSNPLTSYAVQLSTVFEMVLMALALGDLLRLEHKARNVEQAQALTVNKALLEITQASEEKLKQAVHQRTEQLEKSLSQEKGLREQYVRFGSMISHEFRTPLSIIQSQASLLRKEHEHGVDHVTKRLEAIASATKRLTVMFDKWLNSDAITQTMEELEIKPLELHPWLSTLIKTSSHLLLNHQIAVKNHPQVNSVLADEYHLGLAIINLIDNATKYSPAGSTILIETRLQAGHVGIAVVDQGPGIAQDLHERVFSEFFRVSPESHIRGVGLGLSIVQRIARAHHGYVNLTSSFGQGATFCIWLPADDIKERK